MNHLGTKTIETDRLFLRKFKLHDAENMYKNWAGDHEVTKFLRWPTHSDVEVSKSVISRWMDEYSDEVNYQWCIELKETKEAIGSIGAFNIDDKIESVEVGYCIGKDYWKKGIVTEAFSSVIDFFFGEVNFNRIVAKHDINNPASGKVMIKCGLQLEGIMRQASSNNTGICDIASYAILKEEWEKKYQN